MNEIINKVSDIIAKFRDDISYFIDDFFHFIDDINYYDNATHTSTQLKLVAKSTVPLLLIANVEYTFLFVWPSSLYTIFEF